MQAVKSKIRGRKSYFRHDAIEMKKSKKKCTFNNREYREIQVKSILNRIKRIKVPNLYKLPPKNSLGKAIKIKDSEFIEASYTRSELTFYETELGEVKYGKNPKIDSKFLLIRPDVTFFDKKNEPILFIEIVITNKITKEKLSKIRRLGIDTVQITIPKDSLEKIEESFLKGEKIKWVYNSYEENTKYIYSTNNDSETIPQIDKFTERNFTESFECRKSEINNLIRTVERNLESQQYLDTEREFRKEIFRVEENTKRFEIQLEEHRERIRKKLNEEYSIRRERIGRRRSKLEQRRKTLYQNFRSNKDEVNTEFEKSERGIESNRENLERRYLDKKREIEEDTRNRREGVVEELEHFESAEIRIREDSERIETEKEQIESNIERELKKRKTLPKKITELTENEQREFRENTERVIEEFAEIRRRRVRQIKKEDTTEPSEFTKGLKTIYNKRNIAINWEKTQLDYKRNKEALKYFRRETHKNRNEQDRVYGNNEEE